MSNGLGAVAKYVKRQAQVPKRVSFSPPVANLAGDGEMLLVELDGAAGLAQIRVGVAQVAQDASFSSPVANLAGDDELLLVELDGAAGLAQSCVGNAQVAQRVLLPPAGRRSREQWPSACS